MAVPDETKDRVCPPGPDPDDHHAREELLLDRERNHTGIKMAERHPPFLSQKMQRAFFGVEQP